MIKFISKLLKLIAKDTLIIYLKGVWSPSFTLSNWTKEDHKHTVQLNIDNNIRVIFRFEADLLSDEGKLREIEFPISCEMFIVINRPSQFLLDGLNNKSEASEKEVANKIYSIYTEAANALTLHGRWYLKLPSILDFHPSGFHELFYQDGLFARERVFWKTGRDEFKPFNLSKVPERTINPIFAPENLLTVERWKDFGKYLSKKPIISTNIAELVRIKSKIVWGSKRIPTIETAALIEVVIRNKVTTVLGDRGVSNNKLKGVNDEAGLSILLNMLLPLIIEKKDISKYKDALDNLDALRRVRNNIMHENITEDAIDLEVIKRGVDAAIEITKLLEGK